MKYDFHPDALTEYSNAVNYYLEQRVEVAQMFINAIEETIFRIREFPERYGMIAENVRRCMVKRFPYSILYSVEKDLILILAVMHCSRKPNYWTNRKASS